MVLSQVERLASTAVDLLDWEEEEEGEESRGQLIAQLKLFL